MMSDTMLVTYATRYGSTREVAERIAATLRGEGLTVKVQPAKQVKTLEDYRAVVLGAPLYIGRWLKDARNFLEQHQAALTTRPVAIFTLGPTRGDENWDEEIQPQIDKELAQYPWLDPVAVELFGGKYDPTNLRFLDKLLAALPASPLHDLPANDLRDWDAIQAWASGLAPQLTATP